MRFIGLAGIAFSLSFAAVPASAANLSLDVVVFLYQLHAMASGCVAHGQMAGDDGAAVDQHIKSMLDQNHVSEADRNNAFNINREISGDDQPFDEKQCLGVKTLAKGVFPDMFVDLPKPEKPF